MVVAYGLGFSLVLGKVCIGIGAAREVLGLDHCCGQSGLQAHEISIPQDKVDRIKAGITTHLHKMKASSREMAGTAGTLTSASPALCMAPLYLRSHSSTMQPG